MAKITEIFNIIIIIALIILGVFIAYQIILKILGGSWQTEDIVVTLLILQLGFIFGIAIKLTKIESNFNNLKNSFCSLASDFKEHIHSHNSKII